MKQKNKKYSAQEDLVTSNFPAKTANPFFSTKLPVKRGKK